MLPPIHARNVPEALVSDDTKPHRSTSHNGITAILNQEHRHIQIVMNDGAELLRRQLEGA